LGSGYAPVAPGTAGAALGLVLFWFLPRAGAGAIAATALVFLVGALAASRVAAAVGRKDPGIVVVDEIVGMWVSLAFIPLNLVTAGLAFFFFRLLDIWKPFPARDLERLPGGWGIMADDVMAGVYANLLVRVCLLI